MTLKFNRLLEVVKVHVRASVGSRTQKAQKTQVTLIFEYDLEVQQGSRDRRGTYSCKISSR